MAIKNLETHKSFNEKLALTNYKAECSNKRDTFELMHLIILQNDTAVVLDLFTFRLKHSPEHRWNETGEEFLKQLLVSLSPLGAEVTPGRHCQKTSLKADIVN